mmetsp:Transcript_96294/g.281282  ORF Transcript_96294/g.281282 Transcript_96294/m.281282 type:complete len:201 (+) Transcript_96294:1118-1720(+)
MPRHVLLQAHLLRAAPTFTPCDANNAAYGRVQPGKLQRKVTQEGACPLSFRVRTQGNNLHHRATPNAFANLAAGIIFTRYACCVQRCQELARDGSFWSAFRQRLNDKGFTRCGQEALHNRGMIGPKIPGNGNLLKIQQQWDVPQLCESDPKWTLGHMLAEDPQTISGLWVCLKVPVVNLAEEPRLCQCQVESHGWDKVLA